MSPNYSRREFAKLSLAALPAASLFSFLPSVRAEDAPTGARPKPNSKVAGVQIGINVPYSFADLNLNGTDTLNNCVQLGISAVELRTQPVETFLGAPPLLPKMPRHPSAEQAAAKRKRDAAVREWRLSAPIDRAADFRRQYEDAGVRIDIVKVDDLFLMVDAEIDYAFELAKKLGARAMSSEISKSADDLKRVGAFAAKHQLMVGYHGHAAVTPEMWEAAFSYSKYNGANVDLGHFIAGNNYSPVPFIKQYHERITHVHVKDRKFHQGPNVPLGQGDTPVAEVLRLLKKTQWPIDAVLEFEYPIPAGSTRMAEIGRMVQYCRDALA